ncbi:MAG: LexA family transcriptional regulator [Sphingomonas sp.]|nr:LexA family transcriptional regulator [Sphingomonas sp.]
MLSDDPRAALAALASERGASLAALSRLIGRNDAYLQQFVQRGSPRRLAEADRRLIAAYLGVDERALGATDPRPQLVRVPQLDVAASAGPGALVDEDRHAGGEAIDPALLRRLGVRAEDLSIVTARGESMLPTIADGDELLVDRSDRRLKADGLFVARIDGALVVKRLARDGAAIVVTSDNPAYPPDRVTSIDVIGRVVRLTRRLK